MLLWQGLQQNRVQPAPTSGSEFQRAGSGRRSKDDLDCMVQDVETEIDQVAAVTDREIRELYSGLERAERSGGTTKDPAPTRTAASGNNRNAAVARNGGSDSGASRNSLAGRYLSNNPSAALNEADSEEVLMSHQIMTDDMKATDELTGQFNALKKQIAEYKKRCTASNDKLRELKIKHDTLEKKCDDLEDENHALRSGLESAGASNNDVPIGALAPATSAGHLSLYSRMDKRNADLHKRSEQIRKALLAEDNDDDAEILAAGPAAGGKFHSHDLYTALKAFVMYYLPFKKDIRNIQARFGSSVAAYFIFHRLVYVQFVFLSALMMVFFCYHIIEMAETERTVQAFLSGDGYLPRFMALSTYAKNERLEYTLSVMFPMILMVIFLCMKLVSEHKMAITFDAVETGKDKRYSNEVLCAWDFSTFKKIEIDDRSGYEGNKLLQMLEETRAQGVKKSRNKYEVLLIFVRRAFGFLLFLAVLVASFTSIIYITINSSNISNQASSVSGLGNIGALVAPFSLTVINFSVPKALEIISIIESWDSAETELNFLLLRVYLSSTLNSVILAFSYLLLIDPFLMADQPSLRRSLELKFSDSFRCRFDQAADGLFVLVGFTWFFELVGNLGEPITSKLKSKFLRSPWKKPEFKVADSMVKKLSFLGLVFVSLPICPLAIIFVPIYLLVWFKWEKYCIKHFYNKPRRRFRGTRARLTFIFFYLVTYVLLGMTVAGYVLTTKTMPKSCDIQDEFVDLCEDAVGSQGNDLCTADTNSMFYNMWGKDDEYPKNICRDACGPFVDERFFAAPFKDNVTDTPVLHTIWEIVFKFPYIPWALVILLSLVIAMRNNSNDVAKLSAFYRDRTLLAQIEGSEIERRRQEKIIEKLKSIEDINEVRDFDHDDGSGDDDDDNNEYNAAAGTAARPGKDQFLAMIDDLERKSTRMVDTGSSNNNANRSSNARVSY